MSTQRETSDDDKLPAAASDAARESRQERQGGAARRGRKDEGSVWGTVRLVLEALLIAFVIRTFFYQPYNIPSSSMVPTLLVGDYLFVGKLSYGYGPYSFNFSFSPFGYELFSFGPLPFKGRIFADEPERGDIIVFKLPRDPKVDYIKRVIGLPGDRIQVIDGVVHINGQPVKRQRIEDRVVQDGPYAGMRVPQYRETLPNGRSYVVQEMLENGPADNTGVYVVPEGHYFVMGDNRDNSTDSRDQYMVGYIPYENLMGEAKIIFFSHNEKASLLMPWTWFGGIRFWRIGTLLGS